MDEKKEEQRTFEIPTVSGKVEVSYEELAAVGNGSAEKKVKDVLESRTEVAVRGCQDDIGYDQEMLEARAMDACRRAIRKVLAGEKPAWDKANRLVVTVSYTR